MKNTAKQQTIGEPLDFIQLELEALITDMTLSGTYTILPFRALDGLAFTGKYIQRLIDNQLDILKTVHALTSEEYLEVLSKTMVDGVLIKNHNFDSLFADKLYEARAVAAGSLLFHLNSSEKKTSGIKVDLPKEEEV